MSLTEKEKQNLYKEVLHNGFDFCFIDFSDWTVIKDEKFHELRKKWLKAREEFTIYCGLDADDPPQIENDDEEFWNDLANEEEYKDDEDDENECDDY